MHPKAECTKCGQRNFASLDNLETHIVKQHFSVLDNIRNVFYKCSYLECWFRFPTELARLKHELDVHLKGDLASLTLPQMERRYFLRQRLAIHDCLNESINVTGIFSVPADPNVNNSESPTSTDDEGKKSANPVNESIDAVVTRSKAVNLDRLFESTTINIDRLFEVTPSTTAQTSKLQNWSTNNPAINDKNETMTERENSLESCDAKVGARLSSVTVTALDPALSNNEPTDKNNETIENENASNPFVVKDEPSFMDELAPSSSDHSDKLTLESIDKSNKRTQLETSSRPFVIKDEPILIDEFTTAVLPNHNDSISSNFESSAPKPEHKRNEHEHSVVKVVEELTTAFPAFPDHDYLSFSNNESAVAYPQPKRSKTEISPNTSPKASVVKDEPSLIDELAAMIPGPSNYDDDLTSLPSETQPVDSDDELRNILPGRLERSKNLTTAEKEAIVKAKFDGKPWKIRKILTQRGDLTFVDSDDEPDIISPAKDCGRYPGIFALIRKKLTTSEKEAIVRAVNEGQKVEDIAKTFACRERTVSYVLNQWKSEGSVETKTKPRKTTEAMELVIAENARKAVKYSGADAVRDMRKEFGIKIGRKTGFRILQRHNLIRRKREKKEEDRRSSTQTGSRNGRTEKSQLKRKFKPHRFMRKNETHPMDSDDELRIIVTGDVKRKPKYRKNCTTSEKEAIVRAKNEGHHPVEIAKTLDCTRQTVHRVLRQWESEGSVETKMHLAGGKRKTTAAMELVIAENARKSVKYSGADAVRDMRKQFGIKISHQTGMTILRRQNFIRHRHATKPQSTEDPEMHLT
ncbi:homeodomain-like domain-containing protein [Ditylenchus destructor]|nr:homeodomain-like domain-containing protein [Ditylenchus destructor]